MTKFLVLSKRIINTKYIYDIKIDKNKFIISLFTQSKFMGFIFYGSGFISNSDNFEHEIIIIDKYNTKDNKNYNLDYEKVSSFITSLRP